jgi:hypothetical protein
VAGAFFLLSGASLPFTSESGSEVAESAAPEGTTAETEVAAQPDEPSPSVIPTPVAAILEFSASPTEVTYRTDGNVTLSWRVENPVSVSVLDENEEFLPLSADDLSTGRYEIPAASLEWGEHTYQLTIVGDDNIRRSEAVTITVNSFRCTVDPAEAEVFARPNSISVRAPDFESGDLVILGRNEDGDWLWVGYNDLSAPEWNDEGWVQHELVECPPGTPFERYIVVDELGNPLAPGEGEEMQTPEAPVEDNGAESSPGE